ncbi:hypothetical protein SK128_013096 [Halocaridina rubra]|uniref:Uncharacterized protein n=1 Tax=Halocaridina rubra TaxID=373956 RepID=A0AAN8XGG8_HALRR
MDKRRVMRIPSIFDSDDEEEPAKNISIEKEENRPETSVSLEAAAPSPDSMADSAISKKPDEHELLNKDNIAKSDESECAEEMDDLGEVEAEIEDLIEHESELNDSEGNTDVISDDEDMLGDISPGDEEEEVKTPKEDGENGENFLDKANTYDQGAEENNLPGECTEADDVHSEGTEGTGMSGEGDDTEEAGALGEGKGTKDEDDDSDVDNDPSASSEVNSPVCETLEKRENNNKMVEISSDMDIASTAADASHESEVKRSEDEVSDSNEGSGGYIIDFNESHTNTPETPKHEEREDSVDDSSSSSQEQGLRIDEEEGGDSELNEENKKPVTEAEREKAERKQLRNEITEHLSAVGSASEDKDKIMEEDAVVIKKEENSLPESLATERKTMVTEKKKAMPALVQIPICNLPGYIGSDIDKEVKIGKH